MFTINLKYIAAAMTAMAEMDVRYYLNGVYIEPVDDSTCFVVATDGHRLLAVRAPIRGAVPRAGIIPGTALMALKIKPDQEADITFHEETALANKFSITNRSLNLRKNFTPVTLSGTLIDGRFPDWRKVIPKKVGPDPMPYAQVNPDYMADMSKAFKLLSEQKDPAGCPNVIYSGNDNVVIFVRSCQDAIGLVMPIRLDTDAMSRVRCNTLAKLFGAKGDEVEPLQKRTSTPVAEVQPRPTRKGKKAA